MYGTCVSIILCLCYRNVSSAGDYGRKKLRECEGLVDALLYLVRNAIERANIDNKSVENAVCVLRNLSYRAQEVEDPNYDKRQLPVGETRAAAGKPGSEAASGGCFGASKAKPTKGGGASGGGAPASGGSSSQSGRSGGPVAGMELLWQPEVVQPYLNLLSNCSNPETLEAAAGAIQNLSACYWQPSIDIRCVISKIFFILFCLCSMFKCCPGHNWPRTRSIACPDLDFFDWLIFV